MSVVTRGVWASGRPAAAAEVRHTHLDGGREVEAAVEYRVEGEAHQVQRQEVKVEPDHAGCDKMSALSGKHGTLNNT